MVATTPAIAVVLSAIGSVENMRATADAQSAIGLAENMRAIAVVRSAIGLVEDMRATADAPSAIGLARSERTKYDASPCLSRNILATRASTASLCGDEFAPDYQRRFDEVIAPAICSIQLPTGIVLQPYRVDISKSGDSILTDIMDGIAHSQLILADVSTIGNDSRTGLRYRNGNVMYEVGLALACRQSSEVLLVRDDEDKFLFDVSTIPHKKIDFTDVENAKDILSEELRERLKEQRYVNDSRVELAMAQLSPLDVLLLRQFATDPDQDYQITITPDNVVSISRLLDKQLIMTHNLSQAGGAVPYALTSFGKAVVERVFGAPGR